MKEGHTYFYSKGIYSRVTVYCMFSCCYGNIYRNIISLMLEIMLLQKLCMEIILYWKLHTILRAHCIYILYCFYREAIHVCIDFYRVCFDSRSAPCLHCIYICVRCVHILFYLPVNRKRFYIKAATLLGLSRVVWSVEQALALTNTCDHTIQISHALSSL